MLSMTFMKNYSEEAVTSSNDTDNLHSISDQINQIFSFLLRGGSRTAATSKMERFVIIVNGF